MGTSLKGGGRHQKCTFWLRSIFLLQPHSAAGLLAVVLLGCVSHVLLFQQLERSPEVLPSVPRRPCRAPQRKHVLEQRFRQ